MVTEGKSVPPKLQALLNDPVICGRIGAAWEALKEAGVAIIMDLPKFCQDRKLDPSATVTAANKILTTLEVFKDQALLDRQNATPNEDQRPNPSTTTARTRKPAARR